MKDDGLAAIRNRLEERLALLTVRAGKIESDLRKPQNRDWEERATEIEDDEILESLDLSTLEEVKQIQSALELYRRRNIWYLPRLWATGRPRAAASGTPCGYLHQLRVRVAPRLVVSRLASLACFSGSD